MENGSLLSINLVTVAATIINFLVLLLVLRIFLYRPLLAHMEKRRETIREALAQRDAAAREAARLEREAAERLREVRQEIKHLYEHAEAEGKELRARLLAEAEAQAREIIAEARLQAARERKEALEGLREDIVALACAAASRVLGTVVDEKTQERLVRDFLQELGSAGQGGQV